MQFSKFLIASVTALSLSLTLNPAHAGDSFVSIEQYGADNEFGGSQHGHRHRLTIYQNGYGNSSINSQEGGYNKGVVGQDGYDNFVDSYQRGSTQHCRYRSVWCRPHGDHYPGWAWQRHRRDSGRTWQQR